MQCDHVNVFRKSFLYRMHPILVGIFLADMFAVVTSCSYRRWMSWLCHNTAIESDNVQLPARMSFTRSVLFRMLMEITARHMHYD